MHIFTVLGTANEQARLTSDASGSGWGTGLVKWHVRRRAHRKWRSERTVKARGLQNVLAASPVSKSAARLAVVRGHTWRGQTWRVRREQRTVDVGEICEEERVGSSEGERHAWTASADRARPSPAAPCIEALITLL